MDNAKQKLNILKRHEERMVKHRELDNKTDRHIDLGNKIFWSRKTKKEKGIGKMQLK